MTLEVLITFGGIETDVTEYVKNAAINRGRPQRYGVFPAGIANIILDNRDRDFDPLYTDGPYYGNIRPRIPIRIVDEEIELFVGLIDDYDFQYPNSQDATVEVRCVDGLALLNQTSLNTFTNVQQTAGQRITSVVTRPEVAYTGPINLDAGLTELQADTVDQNTNTFGYLQQVAATDIGRLFVDRTGTLRYLERTDSVTKDAVVIFASSEDPYLLQLVTLSSATLWFDADNPEPIRNDLTAASQGAIELQDATLWFDASDPAYVPPIIAPTTVEVEFGTEELFNRVSVTRLNGATAEAIDQESIDLYGTRTFAQASTLFLDDVTTQLYADFIVSESADPTFRITGHELFVTAQDATSARYLKRLDVGDVVRTIWTPNNVGSPQDIFSIVERVTRRLTPASHRMTVTLTPRPTGGFILDSLTDGILDTSEITY